MEIDLHRASLFRYSAKFYSMEINIYFHVCSVHAFDLRYSSGGHFKTIYLITSCGSKPRIGHQYLGDLSMLIISGYR